MPPYADAQLLELWESGLVQHPVDRALSLLIAAEPAETRSSLARLPVGELDGRLLQAYRAAFGPRLDCLAACPACGQALEFSLDAAALEAQPDHARNDLFNYTHGDFALQFRLPNSLDLARAAANPDDDAARAEILSSCLLSAKRGTQAISISELPETVSLGLEQAVDEHDSQTEWLVDLVCAACQNRWQERLDIAQFIWAQVAARSRRLLMEVHRLASAYGWREADILAMSAARRKAYLELIG